MAIQIRPLGPRMARPPRSRGQLQNELLKIGGRRTLNRNGFTSARMDELEARRMKGNASDPSLSRFLSFVFSISNHRVTDGGKLHPDLILQARY
jgi:hypothetical protein